jgi:membrane protease YdiL (CAAX protease family)
MTEWHNRIALVGLGAWNLVVNRHLPERHYVPANLTVAAATYLLARTGGAGNGDLGMRTDKVGGGLRWGAAGAGLVAAGAVAASRHTKTRGLFDDARAASGNTAYETLLRIPFGTVVFEEMAFRGALGALLRRGGPRRVSLPTAVVFGLWHVVPTLETLNINGIFDRTTRLQAVAGGVAATAAAGLALDALRLRSHSLLAPMLTHWSANAVSYAIAARRVR